MAVIDDFKARFPEFATADVDANLPKLDAVKSCYYGGDYSNTCDKEIFLNILAHLLVITLQSGSASVQRTGSQSVGDVSVTSSPLSTAGASVDFYGATKYGQQYLFLTNNRIGGAFV